MKAVKTHKSGTILQPAVRASYSASDACQRCSDELAVDVSATNEPSPPRSCHRLPPLPPSTSSATSAATCVPLRSALLPSKSLSLPRQAQMTIWYRKEAKTALWIETTQRGFPNPRPPLCRAPLS